MTHFDEIEELFSQLLLASHSVLSEAERDEVRHFIEVGEYGLALETAVDIFVEEGKKPGAEVIASIARLADKMSIDAAPLIGRLSS